MEIIFLVGIFKKANLNVSFHIDKNLTFQEKVKLTRGTRSQYYFKICVHLLLVKMSHSCLCTLSQMKFLREGTNSLHFW